MPAASVQVPRVESENTPWLTVKLSYPLRTAILALLVAVVSYVACWLGGIIILHSQGISVLWPACAVLVSVMLLVPHRTWPVLIPAGLAAFVVHDLRSGFTLWQSARLNLGDTIEILIVGLGLKYSFKGIPRLNSLKGLAKYCFFAVFVGPFVSSFVGAAATPGSYVVNWRLWFFSDALAFLTLTPAILSWANARRVWIHRSLHSKLEAAALVGALAFLGYFIFLAPWRTTPSVLIYSVVPFLLWAAVRFGSMGVSTSMIVISFLAIWGAIYGHGPFSGPEPHWNVLSLQLFLMFAAIPFMVLAALAEERERNQEVLHESEERFRLAAQAGRAFAYSWDAATDVIERSGESNKILGIDEATPLTGHQAIARVHPDDRDGLLTAIAGLTPENSLLQVTYRISCADGSVIWAEQTSQGYFDEHGKTKRIVGMIVDITDRKHAEHALAESEERLRLAQSAARIGTFEWNIRTGVNTWTPELEAMYGLPPGGFGGTQTAFENLVHPDDRAGVIELVGDAMKTGQPTKGEWRVVLGDESVHWIAGRWQVFMNESGEPSRMLGVNVDVTEHKLAEQELARANERLHLAIDSGSVGGWDFDLKTGGNVWFGKAHAQLGMAPEETLGSLKEFWDHVHEDDREHLRRAFRIAKDKHEEFTEDFRVVWRDRTIHWLRSRGRYHYAANGEAKRMLGISIDITQSKQAEQALRESEQRLRLATQVGRMYAYDWEVTTNVVMRSSEHVKILGLTEPLRIPQQQFVDKIHPDDRPKFLSAIAGLTLENPTGEVTYRALTSDGTLVWLKSNGRGFFDAEGRLLRVIGMVADVTDLKLAEEALSDMSRNLIAAQEQERARIARELHDDINQRVALLSIGLDELRLKRNDLPPDVRARRLHELQLLASDISTDLHALSHELHSSKLDHLGVVRAMTSWCKEFGKQRKMEIDFKSQHVPKLPQEISICLFRVLQEAVHNAAKHSGAKRIEVQLVANSGEVHLNVSDSGKGFDIEAVGQSQGLGLTSMRERVRLVGGTIAIESKPMGGGTTIHVSVPPKSEQRSQRTAAV